MNGRKLDRKPLNLGEEFDKVKVAESRTLNNKHGRRVVVDTLEFADGSKHEWI